MSLQNSRELSGMSVTVNGHEIGVDRVANTCNPIKDFKIVLARGLKGVGIDHISKTGTSGNVDTYTIYFTDGTTTTYEVTNGDSTLTVDDEMSLVSENPVQNKVITAAINAITAADVGAVAKTGDTMTGDLEVSGADVECDGTGTNSLTSIPYGSLSQHDEALINLAFSNSALTITYKYGSGTTNTQTVNGDFSGARVLFYDNDTDEIVKRAYFDRDGGSATYPWESIGTGHIRMDVYAYTRGSVMAENVIADHIEDRNGNILGQNKPVLDFVQILAGSWSASVNPNGYYTYSITGLKARDTSLGVDYSLQPASEIVATSAEILAYSMIDAAYMLDGEAITTMTLYAKTKPTTDFYLRVTGFTK